MNVDSPLLYYSGGNKHVWPCVRSRTARRCRSQSNVRTASTRDGHVPKDADHRRGKSPRRRIVQGEAFHNHAAFADSGALGLAKTLDAFQRFTRPHTMIGTMLSVTSVSIMAMQGYEWGVTAWVAMLYALTAALLANVSIVGLNQCYDVDIDRVNKPYLPLASGEFSMQTGWTIVSVTGALALALSLASGSMPLLGTVAGSIVLGFCYSVDHPLFRWKRFPVLAAGCILAVRAILVQIGFWAHMRVMTDSSALLRVPNNVLFMSAFMTWFSIVIALFKDIPDVRGDERANIQTASVRFGVSRVFWTCVTLLLVAYASAVAYSVFFCTGWMRLVASTGQLLFAALLVKKATTTDLKQHSDIVDTYMFVWKLFYAQYLVIPLM